MRSQQDFDPNTVPAEVVSVFPAWPFRITGPRDSAHLERMENGKVVSVRPASPEEFDMFNAFRGTQQNLIHLMIGKVAEMRVLQDRCDEYDLCLRGAIRFAPELSELPTAERPKVLKRLMDEIGV